MNPPDEFYIGWEAEAAPGISRTLKRIALGLLAVALAIPVILATAQRTISRSVFEWGKQKSFSGILKVGPYPHLLVPRPGRSNSSPSFSSYLLVATWKFGLPPTAIAQFDNKPVSLKGTLFYRDNQTMIETRPDWIQWDHSSKTTNSLPATVSLGKQTLVGEIVDSKCFFGVMNPGRLTTHRACAIRCISGGCPPVLVVSLKERPPIYLLLVSADGKPVNDLVLDKIAEPLEISGEVERQGDLLILRANPSAYRRVAK